MLKVPPSNSGTVGTLLPGTLLITGSRHVRSAGNRLTGQGPDSSQISQHAARQYNFLA